MWKSVSIFLIMGVVGCSVQPTPSEVAQPGFRAMTVQSSPSQNETQNTFDAQSSIFKVVEAPVGELNVDTLGSEANVQVSYPSLAAKDTVGVRLTGVALRDAPIQTVSTAGTLTFKLPKAWISENKGRTFNLTYTYKVGGAGSLITSSPLSIRVVSAQGQNVFKVVEAPTGELNVDTLGTEANVQVSYPSLAAKDTVGVRLTGVALRDAPIQTVSTAGTLTFKLPKAWISENKGRTFNLTYTYKVGGAGSLITSSPLSIRVVSAQGQNVFKVVEAPTGELNVDTLGTEANVQVSYPSLAAKDTVGVRLTGVALRDAPIQTVSTAGTLTFKLPKAWITENKGRTFNLTYTYKVGGAGNLITSSALPVRVIGTEPGGDGQRVANDLNAQYADTRQNCGSASLPAALCSGVILRATINGTAYRAWNPSPLSQQNGGVSFFYLRKDAQFKGFPSNYPNTSGFVFFPLQQRPAGSVEVQVLCIFPIDGGSDIRGDQGCGVSSNYPTVSRSCEQQGITTAAGWLTHYNQGPTGWKYQRQCGFNVRPGQGTLAANAFYQGILAMKLMGAESFNSWNEIRLATWPQNIHTTIPIKAFFYTSNGLAAARFNQEDFYKYSSKAIPIIKLTMPRTTADSARFEFIKADQAVGNWN
ncbi:hypothetical protein CLU80_3868 [Pseudomonas sp. 29]|uniref:hypothetical protein n=1 Tax=Pseudomonas TaxID=286 RepID=UPI000C5DB025|nr:hypothetical protein [Pseudomonas sp. 29]PIF51453.1 hypothetical protein CLU80_3868 [Pseudomonas sp. 29]